MSEHILEAAVIIVLLAGAIRGYRKGFLRLAVWFAGMIAALFVVTKISPYVSGFVIENTSIYENVRQRIITAYEEKNAGNDISPEDNVREDEVIDSFGFPELISDTLKANNTGEIYEKLAVTIFRDYVSGYLSALSIKAGTFVGLFILLLIAEAVLILAVRILEKIPVLKTFNRLLGMASGITLSLVIIWLFFLAVMMFFGRSFGVWVFAQVKNSAFLSYLFNNNILFDLVR